MRSLQDDGIYTNDEEGGVEEGVQDPTLDPSLPEEPEVLGGAEFAEDEEENAY